MYAVISPMTSLPILDTGLCNECASNPSAVEVALDNAVISGMFYDYAPTLVFIDDDDTVGCISCGSEEPYYD